MGYSVHIAHCSRPRQRCGCVTTVPGEEGGLGQCSAHRQTALRPACNRHPGPDQTGGPQTDWWGSPRVSAHPVLPWARSSEHKTGLMTCQFFSSMSPQSFVRSVSSMPSAICPPALGSGLESLCCRSLHCPVVRGGGRCTVGPQCPEVLRPGLQSASEGTHWEEDVRLSLSCAISLAPDGCCIYTERGRTFLVMTPETM